ncbi:MAG: lysylphosphatidylglycerol synthase transmembrane domain-containing protein [Myxococcales bacterium]|nr:flippase-like domain-containing protein [Polyangiaceae bacterium]MDW8249429.1 lysylphosphatidylglycerol synthase transmembrane domain-containing protein [Myxococcales bacterium]
MPESDAATTVSRPSRGNLLVKIAASLFLAGCFFWVFRHGGLPLLPAPNTTTHLVWPLLPLQILALLVVITFRTYRWRHLLEPLGGLPIRRMFGISLVGFAYIAFVPFRMGEFARPYMVSRASSITFTQATGTIAAERIIDGLLVSFLLLLGLLTSEHLPQFPDRLGKLPLPVAAIPRATYSALALFTAAFLAMGIFYWARTLARRLTQAVFGWISPRLASFLTEKVERVADGLKFLPSTRSSLPYLRDTLLYWFLCILYTWLALRSCSLDASFSQAIVILGVVGLGILVPSGPGFFGSFQLASYCGLAMFFPEEIVLSRGSLYVFLTYTIQHIVNLLGLLLGLWFLKSPPSQENHL